MNCFVRRKARRRSYRSFVREENIQEGWDSRGEQINATLTALRNFREEAIVGLVRLLFFLKEWVSVAVLDAPLARSQAKSAARKARQGLGVV